MTDIFLGMPPPNVAEWIIEHSSSGHPETIVTYKNGSVSSFNIAGVFYSDLVTNIKDSVEIDIGTDVT